MHSILFGTVPDNIYWHGTVIHDLLRRMFIDGVVNDDLDIVSVLRESVTDPRRREILEQEFSDVFLVFDMDPHDPRFDGDLLCRAMEHFSDSTDNGKLYLNYPMLESYRHLKDHHDPEYLDRTASVDSLSSYKSLVDSEGHPDFRHLEKYTEDTFREVVGMNVVKTNWILEHDRSLPNSETFLSWRGSDILDVQLRLMASDGCVYVLNTSMLYPWSSTPPCFCAPNGTSYLNATEFPQERASSLLTSLHSPRAWL